MMISGGKLSGDGIKRSDEIQRFLGAVMTAMILDPKLESELIAQRAACPRPCVGML